MGNLPCSAYLTDSYDFSENYIALLVSIINRKSVDEALKIAKVTVTKEKRQKLTDADVIEMIKLKESGKSYEEIGKLYGNRSIDAVYAKIKRYKQKTKGVIFYEEKQKQVCTL